jgi:predicted DCC family thiol-disulfide oxidoreductase YuxK
VTLSSLRRTIVGTYLTIDGRSLALCRIVLASVLIVDVARRIPWMRDLYSNEGLLPNHTVLWRPQLPHLFSVLFMASYPIEAAVGFALAFFCFFCLLVGWRTRLFHLLSFAMTTSLHSRILFAENLEAVAIAVLMAWTAFLPMGRRYSVDALLASLRASSDEHLGELGSERLPSPDQRPAVSLAVLAILLQLGVIYWFNYAHKTGPTWRAGTALYYLLHQERMVTSLGVWVRDLPLVVSKYATYGTLVIEAIAPFLILSPLFWRHTRALAVVLLTALHVGIGLLVNLGVFSAVMIAYCPLLLDARHWEWLGHWTPSKGRRRTIFYDASCGVCFQVVRVLARADAHHRLTWTSNQDTTALPADVDKELLQWTVLVVDPESGRRWTRAAAFAQIFGALPLGRLWAWVLMAPLVRSAAASLYDAFARNRTTISTWLGLRACVVAGPSEGSPAGRWTGSANGPSDSPLRLWLQPHTVRLREFCVLVALMVLGADVVASNAVVPAVLRWTRRPEWMSTVLMYPRISENWGLFSPDVPSYDKMVVVDAVTLEGRHADPYNEVGSRVSSLPVEDIPLRLGHDSLFCDYTARIPAADSYHTAFTEWILRYPERTGNPRDGIVSFEAFELEHTSPAPGEAHATNVRRHVFLRWPKAP